MSEPALSTLPLSEKKENLCHCYKLSPIERTLSYHNALKYITLREKGLGQKLAMVMSQKMTCNLNSNHDSPDLLQSSPLQNDYNYNDLEKRFQEFTQKNNIKDGEIIIRPETYHIPVAMDRLSTKINDEIKSLSENIETKMTELIKIDTALNNINENTAENKGINNPEDILKYTQRRYFRKVKKNKIKEIEETTEKKEEIEEKEVKKANKIKEKKSSHDFTNTEVDEIAKSTETTFRIAYVKPNRINLSINQDPKADSEVQKTNQSSRKMSFIEEEKEINEVSLPTPQEVKFIKQISIKKEDFDPIALKNKNLLKRSETIRQKIKEKIEKTQEKKTEIQTQSLTDLKKILEEKLQKIKEIKDYKQKKKSEIQKIHKNNTVEYYNKVKAMKAKKLNALIEEAEAIKKNYDEKIEKAEINRNELLLEKERRMEEQRNHYNSQRIFVELLQSAMPLVK